MISIVQNIFNFDIRGNTGGEVKNMLSIDTTAIAL